jgi:PhnB protein
MSTTNANYAVAPYIFLGGACAEAIEFYRKGVGAEVLMQMQYKDAPPGAAQPGLPADWSGKIMHASLKIGGSLVLLSDGCPDNKEKHEGFSLTLTVPNAAEAEKTFNALSKGGEIRAPLGKTFFSPAFGMLKDRFGVPWTIYVEQQPPGK